MSSIIAGITKDLKAVPENLKAKAKGADAKKLLLLNVPYIDMYPEFWTHIYELG